MEGIEMGAPTNAAVTPSGNLGPRNNEDACAMPPPSVTRTLAGVCVCVHLCVYVCAYVCM